MDQELRVAEIVPQPRAMTLREYTSLATSRRNLVRTIDRHGTQRLVDVDTGAVYELTSEAPHREPSVEASR